MNLIGKKVLLRELRKEDMSLLNELINDPLISEMVVGWSKPVTMYNQNKWFESLSCEDNIRYTICSKEEAIGTAIISNVDLKNKSCSIDIKLSSKCRGQGFGSDVINTLLKYIFNELNMHRVEVEILKYNEISQNLFKKFNFKLEGEKKEAIYKNGTYNSLMIYALLRNEYKND